MSLNEYDCLEVQTQDTKKNCPFCKLHTLALLKILTSSSTCCSAHMSKFDGDSLQLLKKDILCCHLHISRISLEAFVKLAICTGLIYACVASLKVLSSTWWKKRYGRKGLSSHRFEFAA